MSPTLKEAIKWYENFLKKERPLKSLNIKVQSKERINLKKELENFQAENSKTEIKRRTTEIKNLSQRLNLSAEEIAEITQYSLGFIKEVLNEN